MNPIVHLDHCGVITWVEAGSGCLNGCLSDGAMAAAAYHLCIGIRSGLRALLLLAFVLAIALAFSFVDSPDKVSRAMMMLHMSSRTRVLDERRVACMSKGRLRSSFSTLAGQLRSSHDGTSPHARLYHRTLTSEVVQRSPSSLKVCASTSSNRTAVPSSGRRLVLSHKTAPAQQSFAIASVFQQAPR